MPIQGAGKQGGAGKAASNYNRVAMGGTYDSSINRAIGNRINTLGQQINPSVVDSLLTGYRSGATGGGGVYRSPFANAQYGSRQQGEPAQDTRPGIFDLTRQQYADLENQLMDLSRQYGTDITESTGATARMLQTVDPTAAYRVTAPSLAAPPAAATSYLQAIGANPSQIQAQQDYLNQMLASQAGSQGEYSRATDAANQAYREAQLAELYRNQAQAQAGLNAATQGQRAMLGMQRLKDEQAIRTALLEYQLAILQAQAQKGGGGGVPMPYPNIGNISF